MRAKNLQQPGWILWLLIFCLLGVSGLSAQGTDSVAAASIPISQIFTFLFLMLGPIKIIGPYARFTRKADAGLARQLAFRAILYSAAAVLVAGFLGQSFLDKYGVPVAVLTLAGGLILFLVALQTILQQFNPPGADTGDGPPPTMSLAMTPLAFPTIVTPYGVAAVIVFIALSPDLASRLTIAAIVAAIMALNLVAMLAARSILKVLGVFLQILGSVLGIIQVALGLDIILTSIKAVWN